MARGKKLEHRALRKNDENQIGEIWKDFKETEPRPKFNDSYKKRMLVHAFSRTQMVVNNF